MNLILHFQGLMLRKKYFINIKQKNLLTFQKFQMSLNRLKGAKIV